MLVGYARVSTGEQTLDLQLDALKQASCGRTFTDSGEALRRSPFLPGPACRTPIAVLSGLIDFPASSRVCARAPEIPWFGKSYAQSNS